MGDVQTIRVHSGDDHAVINLSDYDPKVHKPFDEESRAAVGASKKGAHAKIEEAEVMREHQANRGVGGGMPLVATDRNPSGTFSEPTPTDIRYPDKDATEFENNHGAHIARSAAALREEMGLPDVPGGIKPEEAALAEATGLRVAKGPGGRFYVMNGEERASKGFGSEDEANAALVEERAKQTAADAA